MRFRQMDGLRAAAALAVVLIHSTGGATGTLSVLCNQLARFAVPLFLMLTGFGQARRNDDGVFVPQGWLAIRRRLARVLPAYFIWSAVYLALEAACGTPHEHPLRDLLTGGSYVHLYYIFVLLQFTLIGELLCAAVQRYPRLTLALSLLVTLAMQALIALERSGYLTLPLPLPAARWFMGWVIFYTGGVWLRWHKGWQKCPLRVSILLWGVSAVCVLFVARRFPALAASSLRPDLMVYSFITWLLLWTLCSRIPALPAPVQFVARHSFGLYLAHPLILRLWNVFATHHDPVIYLRLWQLYLVALGGGLVVALLLSYLPFGALLGGADRKERS